MNIDGLGEKTVESLVEKKLVKDLSDLYRLVREDLTALEGFAEKSADNLYQAIQDTRKPRLDRFLYALGIRHVGQRMAQIIADWFKTLERVRKAGRERLELVNEIGPQIARSVEQFFEEERNRRVLERLWESGLRVQRMPAAHKSKALSGMTFVFTGSLSGYTRHEAESVVEDRGGRATSSVSGQTDYVVVGEHPGSKLDDARSTDAAIIDEAEFERILKET
jgi:DNA ligase (NAD+)